MHKAAQGGHLAVINFLSERFGERNHERDNDGLSMLHWAAQEGHCEVARYLIEDMQMDPQDRDEVCGVDLSNVHRGCFWANYNCTCMATNYVCVN